MKNYSALLVILGSALWGTDALFRRPLTGTLSPITLVLLEHCVLGLVTLPVVLKRRHEFLDLRGREYAALLFIAVGGSVAATSLYTYAVKYGNPTVVILLQKTQPLFTVMLARLFLGERPPRWLWPLLATATAGAYLMSVQDLRTASALHPGLLAIVLSAIGAAALWGGATVCGRYAVSKMSVPFLTSLRFLLALPVLGLLYVLQPELDRQLPGSVSSIAAVIGMALIPGLAALLIYYKGLKSTIASVASVCELAFPVTAVAVNWLVLDVRLSSIQLFGAAVLVASVMALARAHAHEENGRAGVGPKLICS